VKTCIRVVEFVFVLSLLGHRISLCHGTKFESFAKVPAGTFPPGRESADFSNIYNGDLLFNAFD